MNTRGLIKGDAPPSGARQPSVTCVPPRGEHCARLRAMTSELGFRVGDTVELRDAASDTVGTVVEIVRPDHVKVEWNTGQGYMGKTTLLSVRALRPRRADR